MKIRGKSYLTKQVNKMAKDILNDDSLFFDQKRAKFKEWLEELYGANSPDSEALIVRLEEMSYYGNKIPDILLSTVISLFLTTYVTSIQCISTFKILDHPILSFFLSFFAICFLGIFITRFTINLINKFFNPSSYQKLHCQDIEKQLIEELLELRKINAIDNSKGAFTMHLTLEDYLKNLDNLYEETFKHTFKKDKHNIQNKLYTQVIKQLSSIIDTIPSTELKKNLLTIYRANMEKYKNTQNITFNILALSLTILAISVTISVTTSSFYLITLPLYSILLALFCTLVYLFIELLKNNKKVYYYTIIINILEDRLTNTSTD